MVGNIPAPIAVNDYGAALASISVNEGFNDCGGRGYDDFVPGEVTKIAPSGDEIT